MLQVILGLGGNIGDPHSRFVQTLNALADDARITAVSRLWVTRAVGPAQPDYLNASCAIAWPNDPRELLGRCRELEVVAGRDREAEQRWGPRPLDIDLLLAKDLVCAGPKLTLPHPRLHERRFALEPAAEIAADWVHPLLGRTIEELAATARIDNPEAILDVRDFDPGL